MSYKYENKATTIPMLTTAKTTISIMGIIYKNNVAYNKDVNAIATTKITATGNDTDEAKANANATVETKPSLTPPPKLPLIPLLTSCLEPILQYHWRGIQCYGWC